MLRLLSEKIGVHVQFSPYGVFGTCPKQKERRLSSRPGRWIGKSALWLLLCAGLTPLAAQETQPHDSSTTPPTRQPIDIAPIERSDSVDLLIETPDGPVDQRRVEQCEDDQDASTISGEIVVCREIVEDNSNYYSGSREDARKRYAEETQFADVQVPIDSCAGWQCGIFKGEPTIGGLCIPGLQKCPPPPALIIDVEALPQAPAGSDADRIARGLPPIGNNTGYEIPTELEPVAAETSPEESEEPAAAR
jgi:hypothetical protein